MSHHDHEHLESLRALGRTFFAEQDRLRGGPAEALCAPGYVARLGANPPMDRGGHAGFAQAWYAAFPDTVHHVESAIADGDRVGVRFVIRGTHRGGFFGIPASDRPIEVTAHVVLRVTDGRVEELVGVFDEAAMLRQIGVLPG